jgi:hypothetical protein
MAIIIIPGLLFYRLLTQAIDLGPVLEMELIGDKSPIAAGSNSQNAQESTA